MSRSRGFGRFSVCALRWQLSAQPIMMEQLNSRISIWQNWMHVNDYRAGGYYLDGMEQNCGGILKSVRNLKEHVEMRNANNAEERILWWKKSVWGQQWGSAEHQLMVSCYILNLQSDVRWLTESNTTDMSMKETAVIRKIRAVLSLQKSINPAWKSSISGSQQW